MSDIIPKHQKVTTYSKQTDGSTKIEQKSYYESLAQIVEEIEKSQLTTEATMMQDIQSVLKTLLEEESPKLTITITKRLQGGFKLTQKYVTIKKKFN